MVSLFFPAQNQFRAVPRRAAVRVLCAAALLVLLSRGPGAVAAAGADQRFDEQIAPILSRHCVRCHNQTDRKGGLALDSAEGLRRGGESGAAIDAGEPRASLLIEAVTGEDPWMPKDSPHLRPAEQAQLQAWIAAGASWPEGRILHDTSAADGDWWSLRPLVRPPLPELSGADRRDARTPVDYFILRRLREHGLRFAAEADRATLIRRLYFDLLGLPPTLEQVEDFVQDPHPLAYERLVERLLASPRYGERWGRHWLDVVHYGDTHGYDKDKLRPHAWPYRDYVIRAFNQDKPYDRFVEEQLAGDVLWPRTTDGVVATGFIAAGPWDFIGHAEVPETKIDGKVARHLDRDDMVATTMNAFLSTTAQCAQCHDHKFDPIRQEHYYGLQAVFAALDRADRPYEVSPEVAHRRHQLRAQRAELAAARQDVEAEIAARTGPRLQAIDQRLEGLRAGWQVEEPSPAYGYHSRIMPDADHEKWVQIDLGRPADIRQIVYVGCWDAYNEIYHGFGFPVRYKIELSDDPEFRRGVVRVVDRTGADVANPGTEPQGVDVAHSARYVRITATRLAPRKDDYIFALAEVAVLDAEGRNVARGRPVTALDSIEAPVRWGRQNLVDGSWYRARVQPSALAELVALRRQRAEILRTSLDPSLRKRRERCAAEMAGIDAQLEALPAPRLVYAGTIHKGEGAFRGTGHDGGKPREVRVLHRGDVTQPGALARPGALPILDDPQFDLPPGHPEGARRVALARWIVRRDHPFTWRSVVNRVWQYHFGRAIVETPNDFGRMGAAPSHPQLLDWLACEFRDRGRTWKPLHRAILLSRCYRQSSRGSRERARLVDADNRLLWRMRRRKLEAEAVRDTVLHVSGLLDLRMGGPGFRDFVLERPEHSPHYEYHKHDPDDRATHRRAVYRFLVRSQPQPFMDTLDCADPSQRVATRNETLTALQALAMLNNRFMVRMSEHFADRVRAEDGDLRAQVRRAYGLALSRNPSEDEWRATVEYARRFGLSNACRLLLNLNEFTFVD